MFKINIYIIVLILIISSCSYTEDQNPFEVTTGIQGFDANKEKIYKIIPPLSFSASDNNKDDILLRWTNISIADKFYIYRSDDINGEYKEIGISLSNSYSDAAVEQAIPYYYKAKSYSSTLGYSDFSTNDRGYRKGLRRPYGINASDGTRGEIILVSWSGVSNANWYSVYRSTQSNGNFLEIGGFGSFDQPTAQNYIDRTAAPGIIYYYKVLAKGNGDLESELSSEYDGGYNPTIFYCPKNYYSLQIDSTQLINNYNPFGSSYNVFRIIFFGSEFISVYCFPGAASIETKILDTSKYKKLKISFGLQRGSDIYALEPGDFFSVYYYENNSTWVTLKTYDYDDLASNQTTSQLFTLSGNALHALFQLRFKNYSNSQENDYWYIEKITINVEL